MQEQTRSISVLCSLFVHLLFVKVGCVAESYFRDGKMQLDTCGVPGLEKGHFYFCTFYCEMLHPVQSHLKSFDEVKSKLFLLLCICEESGCLKHVLYSYCVNILLLKRCCGASPHHHTSLSQLSMLQRRSDDSYTVYSEWVEGRISVVCSYKCTNGAVCQMMVK